MVDSRDVGVGLRRIAGARSSSKKENIYASGMNYMASRDLMAILRFFDPVFAFNKGFSCLGNCRSDCDNIQCLLNHLVSHYRPE